MDFFWTSYVRSIYIVCPEAGFWCLFSVIFWINRYILRMIKISFNILVILDTFDCWIFIFITAKKMKFFIKGFFSKCDQIRSFRRIWSHLLKKSWIAHFIFCVVHISVSFMPYPLPWVQGILLGSTWKSTDQ